MTIELTASIPSSASNDLLSFMPVAGKWAVSDASFQHLVVDVAKREAVALVSGEIDDEDLKVELFRSDGRSLDGSDGITSGNLLITRRN